MRAAAMAVCVLAGLFLLAGGIVDQETRLSVAGIGMIGVAAIIPPARKRGS